MSNDKPKEGHITDGNRNIPKREGQTEREAVDDHAAREANKTSERTKEGR